MANTQPRTPHGHRNCETCDTTFAYFHVNQVRCKPCQRDYWRGRNRAKIWQVTCKDCGTEFAARNHDTKRCDVCRTTLTCDICGRQAKRTGHGQRYCSKACRQVTQQDLYYGGNYSKVMKRDKFQCRRCGSDHRLAVHHIDHSGEGLKEDRANNDLDNLMLLCGKCHTEYHQRATRILAQRHQDEVKAILAEFLEDA